MTDINERLIMAQVGSCNCHTKSPDFEAHGLTCRYRVLCEVAIELERLDAALDTERSACAQIADEQDIYWNGVAYDRRQMGKDDNSACAAASTAATIAAAIRGREQMSVCVKDSE